ncbi:MAG: NUDIX hydrolase [Acidimicrobiia bacterium]|nr:MAG: NUDIX hydrolase [Acidimicrobiia bacterium]
MGKMVDAVPVPAATVVAVRRLPDWEVLMVRRPGGGAFGGSFVFPGGKVDPADDEGRARRAVVGSPQDDFRYRAAALRELAEEVGIFVTTPRWEHPPVGVTGEALYEEAVAAGVRFDAGRLRYLSNWVTPEGVPVRFDARFFLLELGPSEWDVHPQQGEVEEAVWISAEEALRKAESGEWDVILPTLSHLELLRVHRDPDAVCRAAGGKRIQPRLVVDDDGVRAVLP